MKYGINTLDDFDFNGKTVLCRLDLNSPYDRESNRLKDTTRIAAAAPTVKELSELGAKLVLLTHQGGDLEYDNYTSTELHAGVLFSLISKKVKYIDDVCGPAARAAIADLKSGEILLLDNVRYMAEELTLFETKLKLTSEAQAKTLVVRKLAPLADIYVCDAFAAAHRDQPTLVGFEKLLPSAMGRLFEKEYEVLAKIIGSPNKPCIFLLGGAKIEDAFDMMPKVLSDNIADRILASGLLAEVFLLSKGIDIGSPSKDIIYAKKLDIFIEKSKQLLTNYKDKIILPLDFAYSDNGRVEIDTESLPLASHAISDIGTKTIRLYKDELSRAKTVFVNGPAGVSEKPDSELATKELWSHIANSDAFSVIGGGDSIAAVNKYNLSDGFSYTCTGGGAMVRFLSGEELPVVKALKEASTKFNQS